MKINFYQHDLGKCELDQIAKVFSTPILTTGEFVDQFEREFEQYLGRRHVLGVTSCTGALHLSLLAMGIGPGDEVITTPMTFIATSTAIMEAGATPVFVDVESDTGNIDVNLIEASITNKTKAILPVHLYGVMCDMRAIKKIAFKYNLKVIEDCAHCIEGERDGIRPGELSDAACFSFYATKNITCGEGGAIATDDDDLLEKMKLLRLHGMTKTAQDRAREGYKHWDMIMLGWKYNMDNIQAAILIPQLGRINEKLEKRELIARRYDLMLEKLKHYIEIPSLPKSTIHARHIYPIWFKNICRDTMIKKLAEKRIPSVVNYQAIHTLSFFKENLGYKKEDFPIAQNIGDSTLSLPFYPNMPIKNIEFVVNKIEEVINELSNQ